LQTLWTAAAECGASALSDVRLEHPIVVDQPRVIQVVADGESVTVSSGSAADTPAHSWISHASAHISHPQNGQPDHAFTGGAQAKLDLKTLPSESLAALQRGSGIEGQPFGWSIDSCRTGTAALQAEITIAADQTPQAVALLDAALQVARLVDGSNPRPMLPAAAESVRFHAGLAGSRGAVNVYRRDGKGDEFIVDIVLTAPDGSICVDIRSLRYAAVEFDMAQDASHDELAPVAWSEIPAENVFGELQARLRAILAHELGMTASDIDVDRPFPELGLDSMMAMAVLAQARRLVGFDLSAAMLWNHPTVASLADYLVELVAPLRVSDDEVEEGSVAMATDSDSGVLDALFDSVESATAGSQSVV
jgi:phthiocerol/phenolphthiocerol synthesis type-I polyketide synthase B